MPSERQAILRNSAYYFERLHIIETIFDENKEPDDRQASLLGFSLEQEHILLSLNRLAEMFDSTGDLEIARFYIWTLDNLN
jgi:hypothetical protein